MLEASRQVRDKKVLWERDSVVFNEEQYNYPLLSALLTAALHNNGKLQVLDFGGALGSTYWQNKRFFQSLESFSWNIVEQPHFVRAGQEEFASNELKFYLDMAGCYKNEPAIDVILFSGVLQYLEFPYKLLEEAIAFKPSAIIIDRTIMCECENAQEKIKVQHVPEWIYPASYACRWLDKTKIYDLLKAHYKLSPWWPGQVDGPGHYGIMAHNFNI